MFKIEYDCVFEIKFVLGNLTDAVQYLKAVVKVLNAIDV